MYNKISLILFVQLFSIDAFGDLCKPSKAYINDYEPERFSPTNNLLAPAGSLNKIQSKKIILKGKILDKNCKVITDAKIYIWQVNNKGKYPYKTLRTAIKHNLVQPNSESTFQGSGITNTDNLGIFNFITIYPGLIQKEKPHVNIRVEHSKFGYLQTKLYLSENSLKDHIENIPIYEFTIVMPVFNKMIR